jgi:hypothetical protein
VLFIPRTGVLTGRVLLSGGPPRHDGTHPALGYTVLIKQGSRVVMRTMTTARGFRVRLRPGTYVVAGSQGACKQQTVMIRAGGTVGTTLRCSIR